MKALKNEKLAGVNNIPVELIKAGGEHMVNALTAICNKIWMTKKWPTPWTQSLVINIPKKGDLQLCQNYKKISLIIHPKNQPNNSSQQSHAESPA